MMEDVEELCAELQPRALPHWKRLSGPEIDLPSSRPAKQVTRRGAEFSSRIREPDGIDPLRNGFARRRRERNAWDQIGTLRTGSPVRRGVAAGHQHIPREAGASQRRGGQFPVARDGAGNAALVQPRFAEAKGKLIDRVAVDHMGGGTCTGGAIAGQAQWILR